MASKRKKGISFKEKERRKNQSFNAKMDRAEKMDKIRWTNTVKGYPM